MTSLQKQLAAIAASSTNQLDLKAQKVAHGKSLLFEARQAANQSFENIYLICYEGYSELCALDTRFFQFSRSLFSEQSKVEDRTQMTKSENAKLDGILEAFICMVGPHLLLKPAEKALEWLVRRFRVHEHNTECLVLTYLPYYDTPQFLALLSILPPSPPPTLRFLHPYIKSPTNPPRQTIVYTAINTPAFFNALQNYAAKAIEAGHQGPTQLSFWSGVTAQAIDGILDQSSSGRRQLQDQKTEALLLRILPALNTCLKASHGSEAVLACYTVIIVLVTKGAFEDTVLDTLMETVMLGHDSDTLDECLTCLAVIAEERSKTQLPTRVTKRLVGIPDLTQKLISVSKKCLADRLTLGCTLALLERGDVVDDGENMLRSIIEANLLDRPHLSMALASLLQILKSKENHPPQHAMLVEFAVELSKNPDILEILQSLAKKEGKDLDAFGIDIGQPLYTIKPESQDTEDEETFDADGVQQSGAHVIQPPNFSETSFLAPSASGSFQKVLEAFEQAMVASQSSLFLRAETLRQRDALQSPLHLSFLMRLWCNSSSVAVRATALRHAAGIIRKADASVDLQNLIPYLLYALADSSPHIRRAAAGCTIGLSEKMKAESKTHRIWASSDLYCKDSSKITQLQQDQASEFLSMLLPMLEECAMDANFLIAAVREIMEGSHSSKTSKRTLKYSLRDPIVSFLGTHTAVTPLLRVRLRLLPLFNFLARSSAGVRTNTILPMVRSWCTITSDKVATACGTEKLDLTEADRAHLAALLPKEADSVFLLKDIITGKCSRDRSQLLDSAFERLATLWPKLRSDSRYTLSGQLLELSLSESDTDFDNSCSALAAATLRNVKLDTPTLVAFLDSVPSSTQMPEGPPAKKRRRTSRTEIVRAEFQSPDEISRVLRRLSLILELVNGSNPEEHLPVFKNLFHILGESQQLKQQSGSELVYIQSLILGSLTPIANRLKSEKDTSEYQSAIRADILIDCIRHSTSPQVQNASLLLIATLASWVPELVLHNLMPVFTFMGSALLRQQDDYSAHIVDQTISQVIPALASSLRTKYKNFLTGVADLLLSFTAAFEHVPQHRRLKLFSELARTLGPEDALSAIIALLVDRYQNTSVLGRFPTDLLMFFDPIMSLKAFKSYLDLIVDAAGSRRKISEALFSLHEKQPSQLEAALDNLISFLADLVAEERLKSHARRVFSRDGDSSQTGIIFAAIIERTIQLSKKVAQQPKLYRSCSRALGKFLDLLPTAELIKSVEPLLANPELEVQIAAIRAVEIRASSVLQNEKQSVTALLAFLPPLDAVLQQSHDLDVKSMVLSCADNIIARFGKRDVTIVSKVARTVSGPYSLASKDDRIRILSLLCLTSVIDVLEDEAIFLLPVVLPTAFDYLGEAIKQQNTGLHNAVYALVTNVVQRVGYVFSRDYLVPVLELSQQSAAGNLDETCDEERAQFYEQVSQRLEAGEVFAAIRSSWTNAIGHGFEASREQLGLLASTIGSQTKAKLVKSSVSLFTLLIDIFGVRTSGTSTMGSGFDEGEIEQLETVLVEAVIAMTLKLNDATFRPFFVQLVDKTSASSKSDTLRSITFYKFLCAFFEKFKAIVTSYSSYIVEHASSRLQCLSKNADDSLLRHAILGALQKSFQHDQEGFWQSPSYFSATLKPLLAQLTVDTADETTSNVISAITEFAAASSSSTDNHREMNAVLLKYMRADEAHTRLAAVKCEQSLTKRLGEEWLGLLPEMLPFISELREDDDEMVERETQRWITMMEEILGEDLDAMLQ